jgi:hypothetical protein
LVVCRTATILAVYLKVDENARKKLESKMLGERNRNAIGSYLNGASGTVKRPSS